MPETVKLLVIDPQSDFCDPSTGTLYVPGAEKDMKRLAAMIDRVDDRIEEIHVTLDSHHALHIAHPIFWRDEEDQAPDPFTIIRSNDVADGRWRASQPHLQERAANYVRQLDANGRYALTVWPPHCLIGSTGHAVFRDLFSALVAWERRNYRTVDYIPKGSNLYTEHYSALQADVPDPEDSATQLNLSLIASLEAADVLAVAGEALTHCLANTVDDLVNNLSDPARAERIVILTDATSGIPGFEAFASSFLDRCADRGIRTMATTEFLA